MMSRESKKQNRLLAVSLGLIFIDLAFDKSAQDPLNPIKFWILGALAAWCAASILQQIWKSKILANASVLKGLAIVLLLFLGFLLLAFLVTDEKVTGLLGYTGRNLGFLNYVFLGIILFYMAIHVNAKNAKFLLFLAYILGFILSIYGFLQHFKIDFLKWNNPFNPIVLFTGNPDFAASLLGIFAVVAFAGAFLETSRVAKILLLALSCFILVVIYFSQALQGLIVSAIGIGFFVFYLLYKKARRLGYAFLLLELVVGSIAVLGMLNIGFLSKYFYKASVIDRGYDWGAAEAMYRHHPYFGVGVDRYVAYFLQYRSSKYPLLYGYSQTVNNAHNVYLNFFATCGTFVGVTFIALISFISYRAFLALKRSIGKEQCVIAALVSIWLVYLAQALISVDIPSISIWGWVAGGALVGLSSGERNQVVATPSSRSTQMRSLPKFSDSNRNAIRGIAFMSISLGLLCIFIPMSKNESAVKRFQQYVNPTDPQGQTIYKQIARQTFNSKFMSPDYKVLIATKMAQNNYGPESIDFFKQVIDEDSRNVSAYSLISLVYENLKNPKEAIIYRNKLSKLDPFGAENLLALENDYLIIGNRKVAENIKNQINAMAPGTDVAKRSDTILLH